jgi:hypothetical protein
MSYGRGDFRIDKPPYELDYNDQLRQAYYDCVVSLNSLETVQFSSEGVSTFQNQVSIGRFCGTVDILNHMIIDSLKDDEFKKIIPDNNGSSWDSEEREESYSKALKYFHAITELFNRKKIFKPTKGGWVSRL